MEKKSHEAGGLEAVLAEIGEFGRFQFINFSLLALLIAIATGYSLNYIVTTAPLDYR